MTDDNGANDWGARLLMAAEVLKDVTPDEFRVDQPFYDEMTLVLTEYRLTEAAYIVAEPNVPYPPQWEQLTAAVNGSTPNELLLHILGWVSQGRWIDTPLVRVHEAGMLEPAIRRLAAHVCALDIIAVKDE